MKLVIGSVAGLALGTTTAAAAPTKLWTAHKVDPEVNLRNRRLQNTKKQFLDFDWPAAAAHFGAAHRTNEASEVSVDLPGYGEVTCSLTTSNVMHPDLAAKFPSLVSYSGPCDKGAHAFINGQIESVDGMSAMFLMEDNQFVYVDNAESSTSHYVAYRYKDAYTEEELENQEPHRCELEGDLSKATEVGDNEFELASGAHVVGDASELLRSMRKNRSLRGLQAGQTTVGVTFRLAMIANSQYSQYHIQKQPGVDPATAVMGSLITMMARVNGVYMRDLGVYFQLIADNDKLLCLPGQACANQLPNDSSLINLNAGYMNGVGVTAGQYDIGHSVSTGSGGVASYPGLCNNRKAEGTTGVRQPEGDPFVVDYVSHELGHQALGAHSFRQCGLGQQGNLMPEGAVEPGSGTSIMGYAGICGETNAQLNSDPYFNSINLQQMRGLIDAAIDAQCGVVINTNSAKPDAAAPAQCTVPAGGKVRLTGTTTTTGAYTWDRVDTGQSTYLDPNTPRFRSWKPTKSMSRFLPNLVYSANGITPQNQLNEIVPTTTTAMTFRFLVRTLYDTQSVVDNNGADLVGGFNFADMTLNWDANIAPMTMNAVGPLTPLQDATITWTVGGTAALSPKVKILIAQDTIKPFTAGNIDTFDYEDDQPQLQWYLVAEVDNTGTATVTIPQIVENQAINAVVMIQGADDACTFYDIQARVPLAAAAGAPSGDPVEDPPTTPVTGPNPGTSPTDPTNPTNPTGPGTNPGTGIPGTNPDTGTPPLTGGTFTAELNLVPIIAGVAGVVVIGGIVVGAVVMSRKSSSKGVMMPPPLATNVAPYNGGFQQQQHGGYPGNMSGMPPQQFMNNPRFG